jgi:hypothetical protein
MASMVLLIIAVLEGATVALICVLGTQPPAAVGIVAGVMVGIVVLILGHAYEHGRLARLIGGHGVRSANKVDL